MRKPSSRLRQALEIRERAPGAGARAAPGPAPRAPPSNSPATRSRTSAQLSEQLASSRAAALRSSRCSATASSSSETAPLEQLHDVRHRLVRRRRGRAAERGWSRTAPSVRAWPRRPAPGPRRCPSRAAAARRPAASARAAPAAAPRSGFAAVGEGNRSAAAVPETEASHQPASRSGIIATVPGEAAGEDIGEHRPDGARGRVRAQHAGVEDDEGERDGDERGERDRATLTRVPIVSSTLPAARGRHGRAAGRACSRRRS